MTVRNATVGGFNDEMEAILIRWAKEHRPMDVGLLIATAMDAITDPSASVWRVDMTAEIAALRAERDKVVAELSALRAEHQRVIAAMFDLQLDLNAEIARRVEQAEAIARICREPAAKHETHETFGLSKNSAPPSCC